MEILATLRNKSVESGPPGIRALYCYKELLVYFSSLLRGGDAPLVGLTKVVTTFDGLPGNLTARNC